MVHLKNIEMKPLLILTFFHVFFSVPATVSSQSSESNITVGQTEESTEGNSDERTKMSWREIPFLDRVTKVMYCTRFVRFDGMKSLRSSSSSNSGSSSSSSSSFRSSSSSHISSSSSSISSSSGSSSSSGLRLGSSVSSSSSSGDSSSRRNRRSRSKRGGGSFASLHDAIAVTTEHNGIWLLEKGQGYATAAYFDADSYPFTDTIATPFEHQPRSRWKKLGETSTCNETVKVQDIMREGYLYQPYSSAFPNCRHAARSMWNVAMEICNASKIENREVMVYDENAPLQSILDMYTWRLSTGTKVCLKIMLILQQNGIDALMTCSAGQGEMRELGIMEGLAIHAIMLVQTNVQI